MMMRLSGVPVSARLRRRTVDCSITAGWRASLVPYISCTGYLRPSCSTSLLQKHLAILRTPFDLGIFYPTWRIPSNINRDQDIGRRVKH